MQTAFANRLVRYADHVEMDDHLTCRIFVNINYTSAKRQAAYG